MTALFQIAGLGLIAAGTFLINIPAGFIVSGLALALVGIALEAGKRAQ
jgi:hypothetical protein